MASSTILQITGMHCAGCVSRVEKALAAAPGVQSAAVNLASGQAHVTYAGEPGAVSDAVRRLGYGVALPDGRNPHAEQAEAARRSAILAGALALPVFILEMGAHLIPAWHHLIMSTIGMGSSAWIQCALTTLILAWPGRDFFRVGLPALARGAPEMNTLVALGAGSAWAYSTLVLAAPGLIPEASRAIYFESAAVIATFILLGRWLEARAKGQAGAAVRALLGLRPDTALVLKDGAEREVPVEALQLGDVIRLRPGAQIAVDGEVLDGESHVDEAMISGEPLPVAKTAGDTVIGGTVNGAGALTFRATAVGAGTYLAKMARMVESAQAQKLPIQRILDRVTAVFVPIVMGVAALAVLAWLAFGGTLAQALVAGVSVLIIACPCAMGLATPASIMVGTGRAAELGVIFRQSEALQRLDQVQVVAFDKTGTLTEGRMAVVEATGQDTLRLAAAVEAQSEHPIARAIVAAAEGLGGAKDAPAPAPPPKAFRAVPGQGAEAVVEGRLIRVGTPGFTGSGGEGQGTAVEVTADGLRLGAITLRDEIKPTALEAVTALRQAKLSVALITGDGQGAALAVAEALGISEVHARVLPAEKSARVKALRSGGKVAFVGDGINDAPALAEADVGIAVGTGTDIAIKSADVVLQSGDPMGAARAHRISQAVMRNIRQNLAWAFGYNVLLIPVAAGLLYPVFGVLLSPGLAAGAMAMSSVAVVGNALRLKRLC